MKLARVLGISCSHIGRSGHIDEICGGTVIVTLHPMHRKELVETVLDGLGRSHIGVKGIRQISVDLAEEQTGRPLETLRQFLTRLLALRHLLYDGH